MASNRCGRVGCLFPIQTSSITCGSCSRVFHPGCSNLTPEEFTKKSSSTSGVWCCPLCLACEEAIAKDIAETSAAGYGETAAKRSKMSTNRCIAFITGNPNKLRETLTILGKEFTDMIRPVALDLPEFQASSPAEVVRLKCRCALAVIDKMAADEGDANFAGVLVEDSCLAFDALGGLPGPYIKWFLKALGPSGLPKMLEGFKTDKDGARGEWNAASAICSFALATRDGSEGQVTVEVAQGVTRGHIVSPRGQGGFGWDPAFAPDLGPGDEQRTYAEMSAEAKNAISHRGKAAALLRPMLERTRTLLFCGDGNDG